MKLFNRIYKWLLPGMKIKRWIFLSWIGLTIFTLGFILFVNLKMPVEIEMALLDLVKHTTGIVVSTVLIDIILIVIGLILLLVGIWKWFRSIYEAVVPDRETSLVDMIYSRRRLEHGFKIVTIGGGTGLSSLLRGLKIYSSNLTAVVTVADDGGSSGRLRKEMGVLPPGDIRNCLVALADEESSMSELFQYRFTDSESLGGHSFGNLLLVAMTEIFGDFDSAIKQAGKILAIRGRVLPATLSPVTLCAIMEDGQTVCGESEVTHDNRKIERVFIKPDDCEPPGEVLEAISEADIIILGPGSLYTSVIPNLLVKKLADAVGRSKAATVYVCNVMTQPGETDGYSASDHVNALRKHAPGIRVDYCLVNDEIPSKSLLKKYKIEGQEPVKIDAVKLDEIGVRTISTSLISQTDLVRHDSEKLAERIMKLLEETHTVRSQKIAPMLGIMSESQ